jgi:ribonuclease-3
MKTVPEDTAKLSMKIGYRFRNLDLLRRIFTHRSYANENPEEGTRDNELLEFLGDSVLSFAISILLFKKFPARHEGELTKIRAELVQSAYLAKKARALQLGKYLRLGKGEEKTGGRDKTSLLANAYESLIGGIFLDGGIRKASNFIRKEFQTEVQSFVGLKEIPGDPKSTLQELMHQQGMGEPNYVVTGVRGPEHQKIYTVGLSIQNWGVFHGRGSSIKEAEQKAAKAAMLKAGSKKKRKVQN